MKGYKALDLAPNSVFISRDVIFHEQIFHFAVDNVAVLDPFTTL